MTDEDVRALFGRYPSGVCVVTVDAGGQKLGLTVGSLVSLSLEPPLVGFAVSRDAALHELLREAGGCAISLLAAGQEWLAQHFARGVPPIAMWHGVATSEGASGAPLELTIDRHGAMHFGPGNDDAAPLDARTVLAIASAAVARDPNVPAVIDADGMIANHRVVEVANLFQQAGVSRIQFVTLPVRPSMLDDDAR